MSGLKSIQRVFDSAKAVPLNDQSRFVIFSDVHRGTGDGADDFEKNRNIFSAALRYYYDKGFTYFELGDGDEMWKNKDFFRIVYNYEEIFRRLRAFHENGRLYMIYGNHDIVKKNKNWVRENLHNCRGEQPGCKTPLFPGIEVHEGLVLRHKNSGGRILLIHGHQADFFNYEFLPVSKFLVRRVWRPLEIIGVRDPTSASQNDDRKNAVELILSEWSRRTGVMLIAGHTHRSMFPPPAKGLYLNDGCCVNSRYITTIEIQYGMISLARWSVRTKPDDTLAVMREIAAGPVLLENYFVPAPFPEKISFMMEPNI